MVPTRKWPCRGMALNVKSNQHYTNTNPHWTLLIPLILFLGLQTVVSSLCPRNITGLDDVGHRILRLLREFFVESSDRAIHNANKFGKQLISVMRYFAHVSGRRHIVTFHRSCKIAFIIFFRGRSWERH